jgi:hypothetical protein
MSKPIKPNELDALQTERLPDFVFDAVNALLAEKANGQNTIRLFQDEVVSAILSRCDLSQSELYDKHYLDFEPAYREAGWSVKYDKPGYNETYEPHFIFSKNGKRS